jgi:tetratricopeptide (TPR) repeat protein
MRRLFIRIVVLTLCVCVNAACASHRSPSLADRFMVHRHQGDANPSEKAPPPSPTLEEAIGKMRRLMVEARPEPKSALQTVESRDPALAEALADLQAYPTALRYVAVAEAYHRRGLLEKAYDNYMGALRLDARRADAYEGLARVWRDWGLPHLGLGDAHRAIYYAPYSASARNTLGTLLQSLGHKSDARIAYKLAGDLDRTAGYPISNLCYLSFVEGNAPQAIAECRAAIDRDPHLSAAHNNLGLTYAAIGRLDLARGEFVQAVGPSAASYNMGIVSLAQKHYTEAAAEFDAAGAGHPSFVEAAARASEARRLALGAATFGSGGEPQ